MDPKIILVLAWAIIHSVLTHSTTYCKAKASGLELNEPPILRFFLANVAATEAMKAKWSDRLWWSIRVFMGLTLAHVSDKLQALCTSQDSRTEQRCGGIKPCGWRGGAAEISSLKLGLPGVCRWLSRINKASVSLASHFPKLHGKANAMLACCRD